MMRILMEAGLLLVVAALFLLMAALAAKAQDAKAPPPGATPEMTEEIIVRGRRDGEPDFQEQYEHHRQEFARLRQKYGDPQTPNRRLDRMTEAVNPDRAKSVFRSPDSNAVQGRPSRE